MTTTARPRRSRPTFAVAHTTEEPITMAACPSPRRDPRGRGRREGRLAVPARAVLAVVLALAVAAMLSTSTAGATATAPAQESPASTELSAPEVPDAMTGPQLRIEIDNGRTSTTAGDTLDYTVTVENLGTDDVAQLEVSQTVPQGMSFGSADGGGTAEADVVRWTTDLAADETATFHTTMTVTETPGDLLRLATVACATEAEADAPLVCATHSDELPAGAAAAAAASTIDPGTTTQEGSGGSPSVPAIAGGVVAVAVIVAAGVFLARRRHASLATHQGTPPA
jgi:uncharacterized repeat protein (TIGR01451 family)